MKLPISALGRDLFADFECTCPEPRYANDEVLSKYFNTKIKLSGYNDSYFFNEVNKEPRTVSCPTCNKKYQVQWLSDGVEVQEVEV